MDSIRSISPISHVFETSGSFPVKVLCEDVNEYVCKYTRGFPASRLFIEHLAATFLRIWELKVPETKFVTIPVEHIPKSITGPTIQPYFFESPCFGSKYFEYAKEIDPSILALEGQTRLIKNIKDKGDILKISLFDLWMANEDRNHNNYNLLLNPTEEGYYFMPIDHEKCFNTNSLRPGRDLVLLTEDESLITTGLARLIYGKYGGLTALIDEIAADYYIWVSNCENDLENAINAIPVQWGIDSKDQITLLKATLFSKKWVKECEETFKDYANRYLLP